MAWYSIKKEITEIAEIKGITVQEALDATGVEFKIMDNDYFVTNRARQGEIKMQLAYARAAARKAEIKQEIEKGYGWIKVAGEWLVKGDFTGLEIDDTITVTKVNGESQEKKIVRFTKDGFARVW